MIHWTDIFFICYVRSTCYTCRNFFGPSLVRLRLISIPFEWFMMTTQLDESQSQLAEPHSHDQGWIIHSGPVAEPEPKLTEETQGGAWQRCIQRCNQVAPVFWWQSDPMCEVRRQWWCSLRWLPNIMRVAKEGVVSTARCLSNACHDPLCQCPCFCHLLTTQKRP